MGASEFTVVEIPENVKKAFKYFEEEIRDCDLGRCTKRYDDPTKENMKDAYSFIESKDYGEKFEASYIDMGVAEYHVVTAKKVNHSKNKPMLRLRFVVREMLDREFIKDFNTKKEADDYALKIAEKNNSEYIICKEGIVVKGNNHLSSIILERKVYKSNPALKLKGDETVIPMHKYIFYGLTGE